MANRGASSPPRYPAVLQINTRVRLSELGAALGRKTTLDDIHHSADRADTDRRILDQRPIAFVTPCGQHRPSASGAEGACVNRRRPLHRTNGGWMPCANQGINAMRKLLLAIGVCASASLPAGAAAGVVDLTPSGYDRPVHLSDANN